MEHDVTLVGILNVTPDSFSDGGIYMDAAKALAQAERLLADGAGMLDVGAEATNPRAAAITSAEEWQRLEPVITALRPLLQKHPFSLDTRHAETVQKVFSLVDTPFYVNDVTTFLAPALQDITARLGLKVIVSHSPLSANGTITAVHQQKITDVQQVLAELEQQRQKLLSAGVPAKNIVLDPGIGFGKSMQLNWQLLQFAARIPGQTIMIGFSNKRFLGTNPQSGDSLGDETIRFSDQANMAAAKIAIEAARQHGNPLLLRVHKPAIYRELLIQS